MRVIDLRNQAQRQKLARSSKEKRRKPPSHLSAGARGQAHADRRVSGPPELRWSRRSLRTACKQRFRASEGFGRPHFAHSARPKAPGGHILRILPVQRLREATFYAFWSSEGSGGLHSAQEGRPKAPGGHILRRRVVRRLRETTFRAGGSSEGFGRLHFAHSGHPKRKVGLNADILAVRRLRGIATALVRSSRRAVVARDSGPSSTLAASCCITLLTSGLPSGGCNESTPCPERALVFPLPAANRPTGRDKFTNAYRASDRISQHLIGSGLPPGLSPWF